MCTFCLSDAYIVLLSPDETLKQGRNASRLLSADCIKLFCNVLLMFLNKDDMKVSQNTLVSLV